MGFEIKSKHAVTAAKADGLPARWLELRGESIIKAFGALIAEKEVPAIGICRWAKYDQPVCCKRRAVSSSSLGNVPTTYTTPEPVNIREPVKQDSSDSALMSAAGKACGNGQTPKNFAASYATATGKSETEILRRLQEYGIAKGAWSWT